MPELDVETPSNAGSHGFKLQGFVSGGAGSMRNGLEHPLHQIREQHVDFLGFHFELANACASSDVSEIRTLAEKHVHLHQTKRA